MRGGYIAALVIAGLTLVGMFAAGCGLAVWGAVEGIGDTDTYGRVQVPGRGDPGAARGRGQRLLRDGDGPRRIRVAAARPSALSIVSSSGEPVDLRGRGSVDEEVTEGDVTRVNFDRVDIPEAGEYSVTTTVEGKRKVEKGSALTFGKALTDGVVDRARDALWGLLGFVLAAAIALITLADHDRGPATRRVTLPPPPQ